MSHDFDDFPVGTRVRVNCSFRDFAFFNKKETGTVVRNSYGYLGLIVQFDTPMRHSDGRIKTSHNFNPEDLVVIESVVPLEVPAGKTLKQLFLEHTKSVDADFFIKEHSPYDGYYGFLARVLRDYGDVILSEAQRE